MLHTKISAVCAKTHTKNKRAHIFCGQNVEFFEYLTQWYKFPLRIKGLKCVD